MKLMLLNHEYGFAPARRCKAEPSWIGPGQLYHRSDVLIGASDILAQYGVNCGELLDAVGTPREALDNPNMFISAERHGLFSEMCALRTNEPDYGLKWALAQPSHFPCCGPVMALAQFCKTLGDWIQGASRYARIHTNAWTPYLERAEDGDIVFRFLESPYWQMPRQYAEAMTGVFVRMAREITHCHDLSPKQVRFRHAHPLSTHTHDKLFGCPIKFMCPGNEIIFPAEYLKIRSVGNLSIFRKFMDIYVKREIRKIVTNSFTVASAVATAIPGVIGTELCTAGMIASSLGMSEKKMQRLLRDEGQTFRDVLNSVRLEMARDFLEKTSVSVQVIAGFLGYKSSAAFTQAFVNWTGTAPSVWRLTRGEVEVWRSCPMSPLRGLEFGTPNSAQNRAMRLGGYRRKVC